MPNPAFRILYSVFLPSKFIFHGISQTRPFRPSAQCTLFGSWVTFHKQVDDSIADELMGIAYDNGINFFDNAEVYALGESEK